MKRNVLTIKQYDYTSYEDFEKDMQKMESKGYYLITDEAFGQSLKSQALDEENWKYTAYFYKNNLK